MEDKKISALAPEYFYQITPDRILNCVESAGGRCSGRILQLNSLENRVYEAELEVRDPTRLASRYEAFRVIKFYRPGRWSRKQIQEEHDFLLDLAGHEVPVVTPLVLTAGGTIGVEAESGILYAVFPKAGGRLNDELNKTQLERLGRTVARLHQCGQSRAAKNRLQLSVESYGEDSLKTLLAKNIVPGTLGDRYVALAGQVLQICRERLRGVPVQRIHGDLHLGNILWLEDSCSIVDFDDMLVGPVAQDIWLLFPARDTDAKERRELFLAGYEQIRTFDHNQLDLTEALRSLRIIHFTGWIAARWEDPSFPRMFPTFKQPDYWHDQFVTLDDQLRRLQGIEY